MESNEFYYKKDENYTIVGLCMEVHRLLGCGLLEIVYKDALEIEFNELEEITWEFRNYSAHANKTKNREENLKFIKSKDLFKTLLNRVILKLSGLDVKYVDYYSVSVNEYKSKELSKGIES